MKGSCTGPRADFVLTDRAMRVPEEVNILKTE